MGEVGHDGDEAKQSRANPRREAEAGACRESPLSERVPVGPSRP